MKIQIGKHEVGDGCKPFIIAEVGSNWLTFDDCKHSIQMAKQVGADAVKFQLYDRNSLYGISDPHKWLELTGNRTCKVAGTLPLDWLPKLKEKADACGLEFMCSAFSPELIAAVDPFVNVHKVASAELTHVRMLEKLRDLGKPVILSTGASGTQDIKNALEVLAGVPVILMYCVAAYPAQEVNLENIALLRSTFNTLCGYSDHTLDVLEIPYRATQMGACVVEKHFTATDANTPDRGHSLTTDQFKRMALRIRGELPTVTGYTAEERPMLLRHNRRIIATDDIAQGTTLKEGLNIGIYRSLKDDTHALSPWCIADVNDKTAQRNIKTGDGIGPGDFA